MPSVTITGSHLSAWVEVSLSQDTVGNSSTLRITALELRNEWDEVGTAYVTGKIYINGSTAAELGLSDTYGCGVGFSAGEWCGVSLGGASIYSVTVPHNGDGTCPPVSISVSLSAQDARGTYDYGSASGSGTVSPPSIPRVSGIAASGVTLGSPMTITLSRASSAFRDTVSWKCGSASGVVADRTGSASLTWTPTVSLASQNTQGTTVDVILTVTTYSGSSAIGSRSVTARCTIPGSVAPTLSVAVTDKTGCLQKYGSYVRTRSQARVKTTASGAYGSSVKQIAVSCGGLTGSGADAVFSLPNAGAVSVRVTVTDSRGRTASASKSITVADYRNPSASVTALYRCGADGTADPQGAYGKVIFTGAVTSLGGKNSAGYRLKKRARGTDGWSVSELSGYAGQFNPRGEAIFSAGMDQDFEICVSALDDFTEAAGPVAVLPVAFSLLDFHRGNKSVGILQRATTSGAVDIGGDTVHHGHRIRDVGAPKDPDDAATLRSVYPVGAVYISVDATSPAVLFGGTWERIQDRFLLASGNTYSPGATGGEASHALSVNEMPSHAHTVSVTKTYVSSSDGETYQWKGYLNEQYSDDGTASYTASAAGGNAAHNNMPPYLAVYMWKRTA